LERFKAKESTSKIKLKDVYENPIWEEFFSAITRLVESLSTGKPEPEERTTTHIQESEVEVLVDNKSYGTCPKCGEEFDYSESDVGRLFRCRLCGCPMRLKWAHEVDGHE
jgi:tRNA(Ile2) C34 agmatinyltransferase TiaS